jgi:hypothetical protein
VQRSDLQALQIAEKLLVLVEREIHLPSDLSLMRRPSHAGSQDADRLLDRTALAAQLARAPVERAQAVENRPADAELRIAAELHLLLRIELGESVQQPDYARRHEVFDIDVLRQPLMNAPGQEAHDRQMFEQDSFLLGSHPGIAARRRITSCECHAAPHSLD